MFAENHLAVGLDVENAAGTFDHFSIDSEAFLDRIRQTGGLGVVVSLHAVLDADFHSANLQVSRAAARRCFKVCYDSFVKRSNAGPGRLLYAERMSREWSVVVRPAGSNAG